MWTSKLSQNKGCFPSGLHGWKLEAIEACNENVQLSKVLPLTFACFAKELVFHRQDTRGLIYRIVLCQQMTNLCEHVILIFHGEGGKQNKP